MVRTLYGAERWAEARALLDELAEEQPQGTAVLGYLGALAARRGDRAEAEPLRGLSSFRALARPKG